MKRDPQADQWDILSLPAIAEDTPAHPLDPRSPGEALWEGKYSINALSTIKATIGTYDWSAMYQQSPQPAGGAIFKREWMNKRYKALPAGAKIIQSWDLPFKASASSAKCAGIVMARKGAELFFCDCVNDKMEFNDTVTAIKSLTAKWPKARGKVIEDKANGPAIVNFLEKDVPGMIRFNPHGSKEDRALSVTPYFEAGNVYFPEQSADNPWVGALIDDLIKFPGGTYKDTVDATVQAILYLMDKAPTSLGTGDAILRRQSYWKR
jgi:predicted phage terminase large subunit-like protein